MIDLRDRPSPLGPPPAAPAGRTAPPPPRRRRSYVHELDPSLPLGEAIRDALIGQYTIAIDALRHEADRSRAVHEGRKAIKRARALLRLVRDEIGDSAFREENTILRDTGRRLSPIRSADVIQTTLLEALDHAGLTPSHVPDLVERLAEQRRAALTTAAPLSPTVVDQVVNLCGARSRAAEWSTTGGEAIRDGFAAIGPGLRRVHHRGRAAMASARTAPTAQNHHDWRKRVRYLRYQIEALTGTVPALADDAIALANLAETLGEEHDLAELGWLLEAEPDLIRCPSTRRRLAEAIETRQAACREQARPAGELIYGDRSRAFVARIADMWVAAGRAG